MRMTAILVALLSPLLLRAGPEYPKVLAFLEKWLPPPKPPS
jgi:hypothetical protein